jgi:PAS domain S-box-containing protein
MARSPKTGGRSVAKTRKAGSAKGRNPATTKRRIAPTTTRPKRAPVQGLGNELKEAREQQAATAEILKVIASSPSNVQPVFEAIVANAARLIGGFSAGVYRFVDDFIHLAALSPAGDEAVRATFPRPFGDKADHFVRVKAGEVVEITDTEDQPRARLKAVARARGFRSILYVPLKSSGISIGAIAVSRQTAGSFAAHQIELLQTFADQAVIAIENVRLFDEVQERTRDLSESLRQQTATADVLKVISRSTFDLQAVLDTLLSSAAQLCQVDHSFIYLRDGDTFRLAAGSGSIPEWIAYLKQQPIQPGRGTVAARAVLEARTIHIPDVLADDEYTFLEAQRRGGFRTALGVPLLREGVSIGVMVLTRPVVRPFDDSLIALVTTFADQAVIAIENIRLFNETQEALERQTATADILKVIASSPDNVQPVFEAIAERANKLVGGSSTAVYSAVDDRLHLMSFTSVSPAADAALKAVTDVPISAFPVGDAIRNHEVSQIVDTEAEGIPAFLRDVARQRGWRSALTVPMVRDSKLVGTIAVTRAEPGRFDEHHVQLLQTFADQAVIAIANIRLFDEVKAKTDDLAESLQQQTATADVLKVISRSAFDIHAVLTTLVESAGRLCQAENVQIFLRDGELYRLAAHNGFSPQYQTYAEEHPIAPGRGTLVARTALELATVHVPDVLLDPEYTWHEGRKLAGFRALLGVPLLREGSCIGVMAMTRMTPRPFADRQIELVTMFADQAVIAIENVRLFEEVQTKTRNLEESLQQQTATADVLKVISRSAFDLQTVLDTLTESATQLCKADMGSITRKDERGYYHATACKFAVDWVRVVDPVRIQPGRDSLVGRVLLERKTVQIHDVLADPEYNYRDMQKAAGYRTLLGVPLMRQGEPIGVLFLGRRTVEPFTDKQVELVSTFADQAVIAIENVRLFDEVTAKTRDIEEALRYQTGSANILNVIASSPTDVQPAMKAIVESACELCGAYDAVALLKEGDDLLFSAHHGPIPMHSQRKSINRKWTAGRAFIDQKPIHVHDLQAERDEFPEGMEMAREMGHRSIVSVPLLREGESIGALVLRRSEVNPFSEKQITLLQTFADQAVIAIENVRLFDEVKARTDDLRESLQQQTATADVLKVISRSTFDLQTVLDTLVKSATQLCEADHAWLFQRDGDLFQFKSSFGHGTATHERIRELFLRREVPIDRGSITGRSALERRVVHVADVLEDPEYTWSEAQTIGGYRAALGAPLLRDGKVVGVIFVAKTKPEPFNTKQIELVTTFADQAVIAIENARLLRELRERTTDLARSVDELTATSDVLKIISRSTVELKTVLDTLVETVARLCRADQTHMFRRQGDRYHAVASRGASREFEEWLSRNPLPTTGRGTATARASAEKRTIHIADVLADPEYTWQEGQRLSGYRTVLALPLLRGDTEIGLFTLLRTRVAPFTDKEIELATTFADQAVIAIENARLFEELRERQAELRVTFDNMGDGVVMFGADARLVAWNRNLQEMLDLPDALLTSRPSFAELFHYLAERGEFESADLEAELSRSLEDTSREMRYERMRPDGRVIEVRRNPVPGGGFVLIYAEITERKRAEEAIRLARDAAETALRDLQAAQDRLVQTQKLASLGQLTAGIAHEIKNPLNFVNNFSALSVELADELKGVLQQVTIADTVQKEVDELTALLKDNLGRVVQHGKRADSIVKNMLLHSREGSGEHRPVEINAIIDESLNLAYHGARAEKQGFNITLEREFDPAVGVADIYPQEVTRVLLNLISNGFYAATQRAGAAGNGFEPRLKAVTRNLGDRVEVRIRDNGTGIPPDIQEKIFNPFFTTKPASEGTGLGLSMSHDIVVKQHGGTIEVVTEPGSFTEFIITLPRVMP